MATEIRLLHHSDIAELNEGFSKGQKGSSIMPHKKNPISGENLCGLARVLKSHVFVGLDNMALWHERDISHSSAERMVLPDHLGLLNYTLKRLNDTVSNLSIHKEVIEGKVFNNHNYLSSYYLHYLIKETSESRENLYKIVQQAAFNSSTPEEFGKNINQELKDLNIDLRLPQVARETLSEIYLSQVDEVYSRSLA